jgi:hypothetical protein
LSDEIQCLRQLAVRNTSQWDREKQQRDFYNRCESQFD